jgi:hypothetical protein
VYVKSVPSARGSRNVLGIVSLSRRRPYRPLGAHDHSSSATFPVRSSRTYDGARDIVEFPRLADTALGYPVERPYDTITTGRK